jgi:hypothetical protein
MKLLFDQRLECRCAEYNLTKEDEEQWEPSDINSDNDKLSNTEKESKEHDLDEFNITTTSKGRTKMMVKNSYILVRKLTWRGLRNGFGLVR